MGAPDICSLKELNNSFNKSADILLAENKTSIQPLNLLSFLPKKGGRILHKLLQGAAKSLTKNKEEINDYCLGKIEVNHGRIQKKIMYRAKGRADRTKRRYCLVNLQLIKKENLKIINNGTKS